MDINTWIALKNKIIHRDTHFNLGFLRCQQAKSGTKMEERAVGDNIFLVYICMGAWVFL